MKNVCPKCGGKVATERLTDDLCATACMKCGYGSRGFNRADSRAQYTLKMFSDGHLKDKREVAAND